MKDYFDMIDEVIGFGTRKENRTGVDTISTFNYNYELTWDKGVRGSKTTYLGDPLDGSPRIPMLTTKEVSWKNIVVEMLWFLSGDPHIEILQRHKCRFWDPWADEDGKVPMAYGEQWRRFPVHHPMDMSSTIVHLSTCFQGSPRDDHMWSYCGDSGYLAEDYVGPANIPENYTICPKCEEIGKERGTAPTKRGPFRPGPLVPKYNDQIKYAVETLKKSPMSRRVVVSAWAPEVAQTAALPPCHLLFVFNVQNVQVSSINSSAPPQYEQRLCLHLTQRSCDLALGVPYNMASYGLLLIIMSRLTGIKPGIFAHTLLDLHIYTNKPDGSMSEYDHIPGLEEQRKREPRDLPTVTIDPSIQTLEDIEALMKPGITTEEILEKFKLEGYDSHPPIKFKVAV